MKTLEEVLKNKKIHTAESLFSRHKDCYEKHLLDFMWKKQTKKKRSFSLAAMIIWVNKVCVFGSRVSVFPGSSLGDASSYVLLFQQLNEQLAVVYAELITGAQSGHLAGDVSVAHPRNKIYDPHFLMSRQPRWCCWVQIFECFSTRVAIIEVPVTGGDAFCTNLSTN